MKILLDMNLSPDWVKVLENQGFEAVHLSTIGNPSSEKFQSSVTLPNIAHPHKIIPWGSFNTLRGR